MERAQPRAILRDLDKKMVFLFGPRQVGKSNLARAMMAGFRSPQYLNYDNAQDRAVIMAESWRTLLVELLRERVASPLSYQSLSEDLGIAPNTVRRYIEILEALYIVFRVQPYTRSIARSLQQQPKLCFYDTGLVKGDEGQRLENLVAMCLQKRLCHIEDRDGQTRSLQYLRKIRRGQKDAALKPDVVAKGAKNLAAN